MCMWYSVAFWDACKWNSSLGNGKVSNGILCRLVWFYQHVVQQTLSKQRRSHSHKMQCTCLRVCWHRLQKKLRKNRIVGGGGAKRWKRMQQLPFIISSVLLTVLVSGLMKRGQNKLALPLTCPEWISIIREYINRLLLHKIIATWIGLWITTFIPSNWSSIKKLKEMNNYYHAGNSVVTLADLLL